MSDIKGIQACMSLNAKLTARLNWFKDQLSPSMWPDHGQANLRKLASSIRTNELEHSVDRIIDAFVNDTIPLPLVNRSGTRYTMDFGTPEQLAEMPMPQPLSKVAAARRKIDKDTRDKERS